MVTTRRKRASALADKLYARSKDLFDHAPKARVRDNGEVENGGPGTPLSLTFLGQLYGEAKMLALAKAYQDATDFHRKHPQLDAELKK